MHREIKFRLIYRHETSKEIKTKVFTLDELIDESYEETLYVVECDCEPVGETNVVECNCEDYQIGFTVIDKVQYTGLKDKNGKEIYEGDVLNDRYGCLWGVVKYGQYQPRAQSKHDCRTNHIGWFVSRVNNVDDESLEEQAWYIDTNYSPKRTNNIEIIGNIYENPELLESDDS